jgi:hypothetical protein
MIGNHFFGAGCATSSFYIGAAGPPETPVLAASQPRQSAFSVRRGMALEAAMTSEQRTARSQRDALSCRIVVVRNDAVVISITTRLSRTIVSVVSSTSFGLMRGTAFNKPATKRKIERAWGIFAAMTAGHAKYM